MLSSTFVAPAAVLALGLAFTAPPAPCVAEDVVFVAGGSSMSDAIHAAQSHLPQVFAAVMDADGKAHPALSLKVAFPVGDGEEVIWVSKVKHTGKRFTAVLANQPMYLEDLMAGDEVTFDKEMIADWGLVGDGGKLFGHYTTRVLLETMPADQAAQIRALLTPAPLPAGWR